MEKIKVVTLDGLRKFLEKVNEKVAALAPQGSGTPKITGHAIPRPDGYLQFYDMTDAPRIPVDPDTGYFEMEPSDLRPFYDGYEDPDCDEYFAPLLDISFKGCTVPGTWLRSLFSECEELEEIDLTDATFTEQTNFRGLLSPGISNLKARGCRFPAGTDFSYFFAAESYQSDSYRDFSRMNMSELASLRFPNATNVSHFLEYRNNIKVDLLRFWSFPEVTDASYFCQGCNNIFVVHDFFAMNFPKATTLQGFLKGSNQTSFSPFVWDDPQFYAPSCTNWSEFLKGCKRLLQVNLSGDHMAAATSVKEFCLKCEELISVRFCELDDVYPTFPNCSNANSFFSGCSKLNRLPTIDADCFPKLSSADSFFLNCTSLTDLSPISAWAFPSISSLTYMFSGCTSLTDLSPISNWVFGTQGKFCDINMTGMFNSCTSLVTGDLSGWQFKGIGTVTVTWMFKGCSSLQYVKIPSRWASGYSTSNSECFDGCTSLTNIEWEGDIEILATTNPKFNSCPLTHECALRIINALASASSNVKITFSAHTYGLLTAEDIAIATAKGWTVASA